MYRTIAYFILILSLLGCKKNNDISEIEIITYSWGFNSLDTNSNFGLKLGTFYSIDEIGHCRTLYIDQKNKKKFSEFTLDSNLFQRLLNSINQIKSDTNMSPGWDCFYNPGCIDLYSGPSVRFIIHRGDQIQYINFSRSPKDIFYEVYRSIYYIKDSITFISDSLNLINRRNEIFKFIKNNTELIIPPPPPVREPQVRFIAPIYE